MRFGDRKEEAEAAVPERGAGSSRNHYLLGEIVKTTLITIPKIIGTRFSPSAKGFHAQRVIS